VAGRIGLIVNPIAGTGGRAGLHGTDGWDCLTEALQRGGAAISTPRAARTLRRPARRGEIAVLAAPGIMGADVAGASGIAAETVGMDLPAEGHTTAAHTREAARLLVSEGVDLILFAGGDGTARDVVRAVGSAQPLLGIPCGVKMRSGVFATSPEAAAEVATRFLRTFERACAEAEILDAPTDGELGTEFYAVAAVPRATAGMLAGPKASGLTGSAAEVDALCAAVAADFRPGILYLVGPGMTTMGVLRHLGISGSAMGVDAVSDGKLLGFDLAERAILRLMDQEPVTKLVLGVIGGQGFLLGRGNQQLGPAVLARLRPDDLLIIASAAKLAALQPPRLLVDAGDEQAFDWISGYHRVQVGPARFMMMRVVSAASVDAFQAGTEQYSQAAEA
jgi:predicted polyphosphate/ATP-dependent NAD kinase